MSTLPSNLRHVSQSLPIDIPVKTLRPIPSLPCEQHAPLISFSESDDPNQLL
jgi:hypothetical protein